MANNGKPTVYHELHCYENQGFETLWFYNGFEPDGPEPADDPNALRLLGPASPGECGTLVKALKLVLSKLGHDLAEEHGADD